MIALGAQALYNSGKRKEETSRGRVRRTVAALETAAEGAVREREFEALAHVESQTPTVPYLVRGG